MDDAHILLKSMTLVLGTAAIITVACHRFRLPLTLGYLVAGFLVGPHLAFPDLADRAVVASLSELGIIFVMFSIGLDFSLPKLKSVGPAAAMIATLQCSLTGWLGYSAVHFLGWTPIEGVFAGAMVAISSTTIVVRTFDELQIKGRTRELVLGVLVVQDIIAIVLLAVLTALSSGHHMSALAVGETIGQLLGFLVLLAVGGILVVPPAVKALVRLQHREMTLIASVGLCFALAFLASSAGYSVALGAFLAGSLIAESGQEKHIEELVEPLRSVFAAIFFVSVGMLIDPAQMVKHLDGIVLLTLVVLFGQIIGVILGGVLAGFGVRGSLRAAMCLAQIGEFSFIIAGLGASSGATGTHLVPIAVAVSVLTSLSTPALIQRSGPVSELIDRKLPHRIQVVVALYGSWVDRLRQALPRKDVGMRTILRSIGIDLGLLIVITILTSAYAESLVFQVASEMKLSIGAAWGVVGATALAPCGPLYLGLMRNARRIARHLATRAFPSRAEDEVDLASAPRDTLVVVLQIAVLSVVSMIYLVLTQPFLPALGGIAIIGPLMLFPVMTLWKEAADLGGHVQAGAQLLADAIARKGSAGRPEEEIRPVMLALLPGMGEPVALQLPENTAAVGQSLAELNLRGRTGATVLAIVRGSDGVILPAASERLKAGDVLALAGTAEAIELARDFLDSGAAA